MDNNIEYCNSTGSLGTTGFTFTTTITEVFDLDKDTNRVIKIVAVGLELEQIDVEFKEKNHAGYKTKVLCVSLPRHELFNGGSIDREFDITDTIGNLDSSRITATLEKGLLTIVIPKDISIEKINVQ